MRDPATEQLVHHLQRPPGDEAADDRLLWIADENALHNLAAVTPAANLTLISNRFDVAQRARELGFTARFSDFDFSYLADNSIRTAVYRISKERPVVYHILNEAWRVLAPGGELVLSGLKQEGIKTYIEKAGCAVWQYAEQESGHGVPWHRAETPRRASAATAG
jgi:16S rRNA (guanine1207-N2)-methyltransferase